MNKKDLLLIKSNFKKSPANKSTKLLCLLVSSIASKDERLITQSFGMLKEAKVNSSKIYEAILQTYLFCGFPAAIEALIMFENLFRSLMKDKFRYSTTEFLKAGKVNCKIIYGNNYDKLIQNFRKISPEMEQWMLIEGYGKVFNRPGLNLNVRELLNACMLSVNYYPRQLYSHIKGCKNTGIKKNELLEILNLILPIMAKKQANQIKGIVNNIFI